MTECVAILYVVFCIDICIVSHRESSSIRPLSMYPPVLPLISDIFCEWSSWPHRALQLMVTVYSDCVEFESIETVTWYWERFRSVVHYVLLFYVLDSSCGLVPGDLVCWPFDLIYGPSCVLIHSVLFFFPFGYTLVVTLTACLLFALLVWPNYLLLN